MPPRLFRSLLPLLGLALVAGCSGDAATPDPAPPTGPEPGFTIALDADSVDAFRGDSVQLRVRIQGEAGFQSPVTLEVEGAGDGLLLRPPSGPVTGNEAWVDLVLDQNAAVAPRTLLVRARSGSRTSEATLRVGIPARFPFEPEWSHAPGVQGVVREFFVGPEPITAEVFGDLVIFQGDIVLGTVAEVEAWATLGDMRDPGVALAYADDPIAQAALCLFDHFRCERWTDGIMGYAFADDWGSPSDNTEMRGRILEAIGIMEALTPIRFEPRSSGERVVFRNAEGCSSRIGRRVFTGPEPQTINLSMGCNVPTVVHEIAHALGVHHEQSRRDRDGYVRILRENIRDGKAHNFDRMWAGHGFDAGPYDLRSIMHYGCHAFTRNGEPTLLPLDPTISCDGGVRGDVLTEVDILGIYTLYPPDFGIKGAFPLASGARFELELDFLTPVPRDELIEWTTSRTEGVIANGTTLHLSTVENGAGPITVTAAVRIAGVVMRQASITLILNEVLPPVVDLGPDRDYLMGRPFTIEATVHDPVDGPCNPPACTYRWSPMGERAVANGRFYTNAVELSLSQITVVLEVENSGGAVGTASVTLHPVYSDPDLFLEAPAFGSTFPAGSSTVLRARAANPNRFDAPEYPCARLNWSSSNPTDVFPEGTTGCELPVTFGEPGTRALTLMVTDPASLRTGTASTNVIVVGCFGNCPPIVNLDIITGPNFGQTGYTVPVPHPGFYFDRSILFRGVVVDEDTPPDSPVSYRWLMHPPCSPPGSCEPTVLATGTASLLLLTSSVTLNYFWEPSSWWNPWPTCITEPLEFRIALEVTDSRGARTTATRPLMVACPLTQ